MENSVGTKIFLSIQVNDQGETVLTGRRIGLTFVRIPVAEFSGQVVSAAQKAFHALESVAAEQEEVQRLELETIELLNFYRPESNFLKNVFQDKFPRFRNAEEIEIVKNGDDVYLVVDGKKQDCEMDSNVSQEIIVRQNRLCEVISSISINESLLREKTALLGAKIEVCSQQKKDLEILLEKELLDGDKFIAFENGEGEGGILVIARQVEEPITEITGKIKREIVTAHLQGEILPDNFQKVLGVDKIIADLEKKLS